MAAQLGRIISSKRREQHLTQASLAQVICSQSMLSAIEELSDHQLVQINWYLNSRPLKCLNWHTPIELFLPNLRH